jgi:hypothetical protein
MEADQFPLEDRNQQKKGNTKKYEFIPFSDSKAVVYVE